jgi:hypothetical protein
MGIYQNDELQYSSILENGGAGWWVDLKPLLSARYMHAYGAHTVRYKEGGRDANVCVCGVGGGGKGGDSSSVRSYSVRSYSVLSYSVLSYSVLSYSVLSYSVLYWE